MIRALVLVAVLATTTAAAQPVVPDPHVPAADAPTLAELTERAWTIWRETGLQASRAAEIDARAFATRYPFAGAPTVGADLRRDQPRWSGLPGTDTVSERGRNELDVAVSAPMWLPGQRDATRRVIDRERELLDAATRAERLRLAGDVREAAWALALAHAELRVQHARLEAARALEADVARRVTAGDLAPADRQLARSETLAAQVAVREAQGRIDTAGTRLRQLTGLEAAGRLDEPLQSAELDAHPALVAAREALAAERARLELVRATRRDSPTLTATARFDRDTYGSGYRNTMTLGVAVPLDTEARNAPRLAAASAAVTEAEIALHRQRLERAAAVDRARIAVETARSTLETNTERAAASRAALTALERAFRAGEQALPEVLRVWVRTIEAELAQSTAQAQLGLAIAQLNQAQGIQP